MTRQNRIKSFGIMLLASCILSSCNTTSQVKHLRLAESLPKGHLTTQADYKFAELVQQKSNGRMEVEVFPNEELVDDQGALKMVQEGTLEFAKTNVAIVASCSTYANVFSFPFLFDSKDHMLAVLNSDIGQRLKDELSACGITYLTAYDNGVRSIYSKQKITKISDMEGLKFRVLKSAFLEDAFFQMGTNPVPLALSEVDAALTSGVIDGAENNLATYYAMGHYKKAKYFFNDKHMIQPDLLYASKIFMDSLTKEDRAIIMEAAQEAGDFQRAAWPDYEEKIHEDLLQAGCVFSEPEDIQEFEQVADKLLNNYYPEYKGVVQEIKTFEKSIS